MKSCIALLKIAMFLFSCLVQDKSLADEVIYVAKSKTGKAVYSNVPVTQHGVSGSQLLMVLQKQGYRSSNSVIFSTSFPVERSGARTHLMQRSDIDPIIRSLVLQASRRHSIDAALLFAVIKQESGFNPMAISSAGARGLMQLMPATARRYGVSRVHDPGENIAAGSAYLRDLIDMFGSLELALAAYNAGEGAVIKYGRRIPPYRETQGYVRSVLMEYQRRSRKH
jgi:hypothetical protein